MPDPRIWRNKRSEVGTIFHRARLVDRDGAVQVQADYTGSVQVRVYDLNASNKTVPSYSASNTIAEVLTNTLQTWDIDADGWNFERGVTTNQLSREGGHTYRTEYYLSHLTEGQHSVVFEDLIEPLFGS